MPGIKLIGEPATTKKKASPEEEYAKHLVQKYSTLPLSPVMASLIKIRLTYEISELKRRGVNPELLRELNKIVQKYEAYTRDYYIASAKRRMYPF